MSSQARMEDVFKLSGIPGVTFVQPIEFTKLRIALRTPGRGLIIEGPSGIGKTTAVSKALESLHLSHKKLSARKKGDVKQIRALPESTGQGIVIIDDFHRLDDSIRLDIAEYLKVLADEERTDTKLVIVGINRVGESLVALAHDLNTRIDTIQFEVNPNELVRQLVEKGEEALNVHFSAREEIIEAANGSFYIAQMLCHETCILAGVETAYRHQKEITTGFDVVCGRVFGLQARQFKDFAMKFARGPSLHPEGRAPYLHILKWLGEGSEWSLSLKQAIALHSNSRRSVDQVIQRGYLKRFMDNNADFADIVHYDQATGIISVEDPKFVFYLRNLDWNRFASEVGYVNIHFDSRYDFALSFAGEDRPIAKRLFDLLSRQELEVFYDHNEQHNILAKNIEDYLGPIYRSQATFVICLLSPSYPTRIWTQFESRKFKSRFGEAAVIPIQWKTAPPGYFDRNAQVGGLTLDPTGDISRQLKEFVDFFRKMIETRQISR